jgi:hypothetical protein
MLQIGEVLIVRAAALLVGASVMIVAHPLFAKECQPRKTCSKIHSCEEATWYLENCEWGRRLDRDGDGRPCESLCGSAN